MVLPPVVGGIALLLAYGRQGLIGEPLNRALGVSLPFTLPGVIVAEAFVAMPFFVITLESGLRSMNTRLEDTARSLGAGRWTVFRRVALPLIAPSLAAGAVLTWPELEPPRRGNCAELACRATALATCQPCARAPPVVSLTGRRGPECKQREPDGEADDLELSAPNRLKGTVQEVRPGAVRPRSL